MNKTIMLAGNPNSGKTTLFNQLTGSNQYVGNWPGVTVEKKAGKLSGHPQINVLDLPGIYSLAGSSIEEVIASQQLTSGAGDLILNIVDGTNLERNLYLSTQLMELGVPMVLCVNMADILDRHQGMPNLQKISEDLGCPVLGISAKTGQGLRELKKVLVAALKDGLEPPLLPEYSEALSHALEEVEALLPSEQAGASFVSYEALRMLEGSGERVEMNQALKQKIDALREKLEQESQTDIHSLVAGERYTFINSLLEEARARQSDRIHAVSDRIDTVLTNRWLALPIFMLVMVIVYGVSVSTLGGIVTDWTNEVLFGEWVPDVIAHGLELLNVDGWMQSLVLDGIVGGVGAVLGFVPQILLLFFFLAFLEGSGYLARVAFIMDRLFQRFGLSGKSFIPMLIGSGCSVPGIMASRTIEEERDRRMTVMVTSFIPCSAKLPIIALLAGAIFGGAWWVSPSAYFLGIGAVVLSGIMLKKTRWFAGPPVPFLMELPDYRWPTLGFILRSMWERGWSFIRKAGTVILLSSIVIWFLSTFGVADGGIQMVEDAGQSFLAVLGNTIAWIFTPLGWGDWKSVVATITGLVAKENVVGTFGILFGNPDVSEAGEEIWGLVAAHFTSFSAYSFLVFNLICVPCFAAVGAIKREMNSARWTWFTILYQTGFAYLLALIVFQLGTWLAGGPFGAGTVAGLTALGLLLFQLFRTAPDWRRHEALTLKEEGLVR